MSRPPRTAVAALAAALAALPAGLACLPAALGVLPAAGCLRPDAANRNYALDRVRRVGVLAFDYGSAESFGAEDLFAKHLLGRGYDVIERSRLEAVLREQRLGATGLLDPLTVKGLGGVLGVDAVVLGRVTSCQPERKSVVTVEVASATQEPVFEEREVLGEDGKRRKVTRQAGTRTRVERRQVPQVFTIDAEVGVAVKLVDVQTGAVAWIGSTTSQGVNVPTAMEYAAAYLARQLSKQWKPPPR